jgi:citrate lyase subunit beta/citryl-CoA lyase
MPFPRSLLFVPANQARMLARAWSSGAEALVLDLEDGVAAADKAAAREAVRALATPAGWTGQIFVRSSQVGTDAFDADVRAIAGAPIHGVVLPKTERADDVRRAAEAFGPGRPLVLLIETAGGVQRLAGLLDADLTGVAAFAFGAEDYRASVDAGISPDPALFDFARLQVSTTAAAAGLPAVDAPELDVSDLEGLRAATRRARGLGFRAKFAIHPAQVPVIHDALGDPAADRAWAVRVVEAYERAAAEGRGAASLEGRMIDAATVRRARALIGRSQG